MSARENMKLPPHHPEAEAALLGCILMDPPQASADALALGINREWFYDLRHQELFRTIEAMVDAMKPVDISTLCHELKAKGIFDKMGGTKFIMEVMNNGTSPAAVPYFASILRDDMRSRAAIRICAETIEALYAGSPDVGAILDSTESSILSIRQDHMKGEPPTMKELALKVIDRLEERWAGKRGLATGYLDLDKATNGGMQDKEFWVIAARPNTGKTAMVMNITDRVAQKLLDDGNGEHVVVFSLEMSDEALAERVVATRARINTRKEGTEADKRKLAVAVPAVAKLPIVIDDAPLNIKAIRARARRYHSKFKAKLFVFDYLQLIDGDSTGDTNRRVQVDAISRGLKNLAKELNVPILVVAQLNRDMEKDGKDRKPRLSDLRESGQIEQDADTVLFLYQDPRTPPSTGPTDPRTILCRVGKQRNGGRDFDIPFTFFPDQVRFESGSTVSV